MDQGYTSEDVLQGLTDDEALGKSDKFDVKQLKQRQAYESRGKARQVRRIFNKMKNHMVTMKNVLGNTTEERLAKAESKLESEMSALENEKNSNKKLSMASTSTDKRLNTCQQG